MSFQISFALMKLKFHLKPVAILFAEYVQIKIVLISISSKVDDVIIYFV